MRRIIKISVFFLAVLLAGYEAAVQVWNPDNGDGTNTNPIIYADYSDPDVIRVGDDYYMVSSSFNCQPGIPVLHSEDLVNWEIISHIYDRLPLQRYEKNLLRGLVIARVKKTSPKTQRYMAPVHFCWPVAKWL